jgi:hypothetical protein
VLIVMNVEGTNMPRGVYDRKKRKLSKLMKSKSPWEKDAQSTLDAGAYNRSATAITIELPSVTIDRLFAYAAKVGKPWEHLVTKAIYDLIPVSYEVNEQFVFNWGKYEGETAASVKQLDPAYIDWACRNITGFKLVGDMVEAPKWEPNDTCAEAPNYVSMADVNGMLRDGEELKLGRLKCWAKRRNSYDTARFRLLAVRANECAPWVKA